MMVYSEKVDFSRYEDGIKSLLNTVFCVTVESIWSVNRLAPLRRRYGKGKDYLWLSHID